MKAGIGVLLLALALVIAGSLRDHITDVGDNAPAFLHHHRPGAEDYTDRFRRTCAGAEFLGHLVRALRGRGAFAERISEADGGSGVVVVGVSVDKNPKLYSEFLKRFGPAFQTVRDPDEGIPNSYGTYKYPETYVIDHNGKVVQKVIGSRNWMDPDNISSIQSL